MQMMIGQFGAATRVGKSANVDALRIGSGLIIIIRRRKKLP